MAREGLSQSNARRGSAGLAAGAGRGYYRSFCRAAAATAGWTRLGPAVGGDGTLWEKSGGPDRCYRCSGCCRGERGRGGGDGGRREAATRVPPKRLQNPLSLPRCINLNVEREIACLFFFFFFHSSLEWIRDPSLSTNF